MFILSQHAGVLWRLPILVLYLIIISKVVSRWSNSEKDFWVFGTVFITVFEYPYSWGNSSIVLLCQWVKSSYFKPSSANLAYFLIFSSFIQSFQFWFATSLEYFITYICSTCPRKIKNRCLSEGIRGVITLFKAREGAGCFLHVWLIWKCYSIRCQCFLQFVDILFGAQDMFRQSSVVSAKMSDIPIHPLLKNRAQNEH